MKRLIITITVFVVLQTGFYHPSYAADMMAWITTCKITSATETATYEIFVDPYEVLGDQNKAVVVHTIDDPSADPKSLKMLYVRATIDWWPETGKHQVTYESFEKQNILISVDKGTGTINGKTFGHCKTGYE